MRERLGAAGLVLHSQCAPDGGHARPPQLGWQNYTTQRRSDDSALGAYDGEGISPLDARHASFSLRFRSMKHKGTFDGVKLVASACRFRESK
jgi:hypothetical protein